jgi:pyridoxamine 5'-phosphate oxidase-like protein
MQRTDVMNVLNDPLAQELMASNIPARVAYTSVDGSPRVVPLGFHWNGEQFVICTVPGAPKVRALAANPQVALTIDTVTFPPHVLLVRGRASLDTVEGVPPEYLEASRKQIADAKMPAFEAQVRQLYRQMVRITIEPHWAKVLDFETRLPTPIENVIRIKQLSSTRSVR